jgi:peptidoglycan/LPS O-acetylase OafA/YrhL
MILRNVNGRGRECVSGSVIAPIQALRGIAASMVVLWHASRYLAPNGAGTVAAFLQPGAVMGVDLFFLISGFIMVHTTRDSDGSPGYVAGFLVKRATRIWPVWIVALAVFLLSQTDATFFTDPARRAWLARSLVFLPTAGMSADVAPIFGAPVLGVGWTLNYEMYFYAIFALSMLFGRWRWAAFFGWVVATVLLIPLMTRNLSALPSAWDFLSSDRHYHYAVQYLNLATSPLILLFVFGALIGLVYHAKLPAVRTRWLPAMLVSISILLVAAQFVFAFRTYHGVLQWGLTLIPLLLACALASRWIRIPVPRWLEYLGDISFSLYLFHPIALSVVFALVREHAQDPTVTRLAVLGGIASSVAVAAISHRYVERGLSDALRRAAFARFESLRGQKASAAVAAAGATTTSSA